VKRMPDSAPDRLIGPEVVALPLGRIARNASYLLVSDVGASVLTALVAVVVARYLGPEGMG